MKTVVSQGVNVALEEKDGHKKGDIIPDPKQGPRY